MQLNGPVRFERLDAQVHGNKFAVFLPLLPAGHRATDEKANESWRMGKNGEKKKRTC